MVTGRHSTTGHPMMVGGPQIGYFFPGLVLEIDMHAPAPALARRHLGAVPGLPADRPRRRDFATTLTSASGDIIDQYAETLCGGSNENYLYKGNCRPMGHFDAGTLDGDPVNFLTTVHGPVVGLRDGPTAARSRSRSKRSSYGKDVLDLLFYRRLSNGSGQEPEDLLPGGLRRRRRPSTPSTSTTSTSPSTRAAGCRSAIRTSTRACPPRAPASTSGGASSSGLAHMHGNDPRQGTMTNWNNGAARGFGAADDQWMRNGSVGRDQPAQLQPEAAVEATEVVAVARSPRR